MSGTQPTTWTLQRTDPGDDRIDRRRQTHRAVLGAAFGRSGSIPKGRVPSGSAPRSGECTGRTEAVHAAERYGTLSIESGARQQPARAHEDLDEPSYTRSLNKVPVALPDLARIIRTGTADRRIRVRYRKSNMKV